ncbi:MAG: transcription-repair coupling factor [Bacteroidales bacterium]|nr:transcription-repair coupling factor [Bacteroidales bacterium]
MTLTDLYVRGVLATQIDKLLAQSQARVHALGLTGSLPALQVAAQAMLNPRRSQLLVAPDKDEAHYLANDIEALLSDADGRAPQVMLFPTSYRRAYQHDASLTDNANVLMRSEVVEALSDGRPLVVVSYADALSEKVVDRTTLRSNSVQLSVGDRCDMEQLVERLQQMVFEREDFVVEPGQYALRGGIVDVFSFTSDFPFRIEFDIDVIASLRTFDAGTQLSVNQLQHVGIVPSFDSASAGEPTVQQRVSLVDYFADTDVVWVQGLMLTIDRLEQLFEQTCRAYDERLADTLHPVAGTLPKPEVLHSSGREFMQGVLKKRIVEYGNSRYFSQAIDVSCDSEPQPTFNKQFDLLNDSLMQYAEKGYRLFVTVSNEQQHRRLTKIFDEHKSAGTPLPVEVVPMQLSHGFIDHTQRLLLYTDHEIFERFHRYHTKDLMANREAMTLKELFELKPGDYVTHIDYGVGRFSGLEKVTNNGKSQELIRLIYRGGDVLYLSIHGLHKISRYVGREGEAPQPDKLGSNTWQALKQRTKRQVKDIAKELIALYAKRKASHGFAFSADNSLQEQMEASFIYEDTPDQQKASIAVKHDMEESSPMDRLVCGDVGFGKTEIAIRAAFKACCDSKQVAVLVPNTILAFQHYNTFTERLRGMPVRVDYLNRFRTEKEKRQIYADVAAGKIDILIGTHAITNKNLAFKDLGLLIIDEEQKFGVSVKEKLKQLKYGVDCLTLTATPIPRTLQFSLMGARDLSIIQTPPPNRQPIDTVLADFDEALIRDAIMEELSRGGQTFFISNRVENLPEMAGLVQRLVPDARVAIAHGKMEGKQAEETLLRFLEGDIDVLVATSIVENGLDIPNANTMIINNAHQFGLSDLHQMRGRVGRSNKKAYCYLLIPSYLTLTPEAQKRLKAIEEFSAIGNGFNIAMRDLDIRGAGNILGAEQSGFISEIGYDMYQKILNEAIDELKSTDFKDLFADQNTADQPFVKECTIETDLEALLPDDYISSVSERLLLYRELNDLTTEEELQAYSDRLADRFGPVPQATSELIKTITLRQKAKDFGIEKLVLKQNRMICHLVANPDSPFYRSENFGKMIQFIQRNSNRALLKETPDKLVLSVNDVSSIGQAIEIVNALSS